MIIWLASYPKSGNTWLRSIISALLFTDDGFFDFELIKKIPQFPVEKDFKDFTENFTDINEIKKYWIPAQDKINLDGKIKFYKTHHLNVKINEYNFTNPKNSCATIYIVRDPRSLVGSISNHFGKSQEESENFLTTTRVLGAEKKRTSKKGHVVTLLGNWGEHYRFWKQGSKNFLLIRYEDLLKNTENEFEKLIDFLKKFLKVNINKEKMDNIIKTTSFDSLKKMENRGLFKENVINFLTNEKINFFDRGPKNIWENSINKSVKESLERKFQKEMKELNYL